MISSNLFVGFSRPEEDELFHVLLENPKVKIERIVSHGHRSLENSWYDQDTNEWVAILKGRATLIVEGEPDPVQLETGSYLNIPSHTKHRVQWTDPDVDTIWLTVHY